MASSRWKVDLVKMLTEVQIKLRFIQLTEFVKVGDSWPTDKELDMNSEKLDILKKLNVREEPQETKT